MPFAKFSPWLQSLFQRKTSGFYWSLVGVGLMIPVPLLLYFQPRWVLNLITTLEPGVVYFAPTQQPLLALTIDDGPHAQTTPPILDILQTHQIPATFFVIGNQIPHHAAILNRMVEEGHELGNHMMADQPSILLPPEIFEQNLQAAHQRLAPFTTVQWMRPASGWYTPTMVAIAKRNHYRIALGSIFPYDTHLSSVRFFRQHILVNAKPGSIIVLHDGHDRGERTAQTLQEIVPRLKSQGYRFVTLSDLFAESFEH